MRRSPQCYLSEQEAPDIIVQASSPILYRLQILYRPGPSTGYTVLAPPRTTTPFPVLVPVGIAHACLSYISLDTLPAAPRTCSCTCMSLPIWMKISIKSAARSRAESRKAPRKLPVPRPFVRPRIHRNLPTVRRRTTTGRTTPQTCATELSRKMRRRSDRKRTSTTAVKENNPYEDCSGRASTVHFLGSSSFCS